VTDLLRPFYDAARVLYPLLPQWYEETDAGINPEFDGLNAGGMPIFCVPQGYTLMPDEGAHEAGHAYFALLPKGSDYLAAYWTFRGFPATWQEALAGSQQQTIPNTAWLFDPRESWAEAFARSVYPAHNEKTMTYGLDKDGLTLRAWFQSLNPATLPPIQKGPTIEWVGPAADPNFLIGRSGNPISLIVDHWVGAGTLEQAIAHFKDGNAVVSAHYIVGTTGRIVQVVADEDTAYQAGDWTTNLLSIGIEHEATPTLVPSDALYAASAWLHRYLADKHHLTLAVGTTVKRHRDIVPTACPGTLDVERIVHTANGGTMSLDPVADAAAFKSMFLEVYGEIGVAALFDRMKAVEASLAAKDTAQDVHEHDIPAGKTSAPKQP
jgi:hypothetical protein